MAWIFSLSAECGTDRIVAESFAVHFEGKAVDGRLPSVRIFEHSGAWWCSVSFLDVEYDRIPGQLVTELRERLRHAPAFRYAHIGVEVDVFRTWDELAGERFEGQAMEGVVLSEEGYQRAGRPTGFGAFREGYWWRLPSNHGTASK